MHKGLARGRCLADKPGSSRSRPVCVSVRCGFDLSGAETLYYGVSESAVYCTLACDAVVEAEIACFP